MPLRHYHRKLGAGFVTLPQMTGRRFGMPFILSPPTLALRFRQNNGPYAFWGLPALAFALHGWQRLHVYEPSTDKTLQDGLLTILVLVETDMTVFYRKLANISTEIELSDEQLLAELHEAYYQPEQLTDLIKAQIIAWLRQYIARVQEDKTSDESRNQTMNSVNPKYVFRNYLAQLAIDKEEQGDHSMVNELLEVLRNPYNEQPAYQTWAEKRPDWARTKAGCSMLSCSS